MVSVSTGVPLPVPRPPRLDLPLGVRPLSSSDVGESEYLQRSASLLKTEFQNLKTYVSTIDFSFQVEVIIEYEMFSLVNVAFLAEFLKKFNFMFCRCETLQVVEAIEHLFLF